MISSARKTSIHQPRWFAIGVFLCLFLMESVSAIELKEFANIDYVGRKNPRQTLDLCVPEVKQKKGAKPIPLIVYIHGGGWIAGDKKEGAGLIQMFARTGTYAAATINYRLTTETMWPAQIHDCKAAIRYLRANAKTYGYDPDRIAVMGASAGGHLAAMLGNTEKNERMNGELGEYPKTSTRVSCVVDLFGPSDLISIVKVSGQIDRLRRLYPRSKVLQEGVDQLNELALDASPVNWVKKGAPPILIAHGTADKVVPYSQSEILLKSYQDCGEECYLIPMEGGGHGYWDSRLNTRIIAFFDKELRGKSTKISTQPIEVSVAGNH
jgi:acetyl esterase/lipase